MIYLPKVEYEKIINQAKAEYPLECCGLIAGTKKDEDVYIEKVYTLRNIDESSEHFSMDPKEQFDTIRAIRGKALILLGNYHSHPYTPSRPSEEDKKLAYDPKALYGIVSLEKEEPVFNIFKITKEGVEKLEYLIS
jgi:[CysO sulfur-carrier protein]-S-L-cysteine hydrolase